jgi:hypothetical protein
MQCEIKNASNDPPIGARTMMSSILAKASFLVNPRSTKILLPSGISLIATIPKPLPGTGSIFQSYFEAENFYF